MVLSAQAVRLAHRGTVLGVALLLPLVNGCGKKGPKLYPVGGKVVFENVVPEGATVVFQPVNADSSALMPSGTVDGEGRFRLITHPHGDGAPAGDYIVLITWYPPDARQKENAKNQLPQRYADATQPILHATVNAGTNELEPFVLTK